jgi:hypothetical protein
MTAPLSFGTIELAPLNDVALRCPEIDLDVSFSGRVASLVDEGFDMAVTEPVLPEQRLHLRRPLARQQAEMRVDHLQRPRPVAEPHRGPERAAWLEERWAAPRFRQRPGLHEAKRQGAQDGVAVAFPLDPTRGMEVEVHPKLPRDDLRLVQLAAARTPHIEFLQRHDVGPGRGDHVRNAPGRRPPVQAAAGVHVVGQDPGHDAAAGGVTATVRAASRPNP